MSRTETKVSQHYLIASVMKDLLEYGIYDYVNTYSVMAEPEQQQVIDLMLAVLYEHLVYIKQSATHVAEDLVDLDVQVKRETGSVTFVNTRLRKTIEEIESLITYISKDIPQFQDERQKE